MAELTEKIIENKQFSYEYQAVDDLGRALGAKQIFTGATVQEVLDKVATANKNLIKLNRELNKKIRLGEYETDKLPEDVARMTSNLLQPRELSLDEKAQFARDILDPEKFDEVNARLIEAQLGAKPEEIRNRINNQETRLEHIEARQEAEAFAFSNPEYYVCPENFQTITSWMVKNNLKPVRENFQYAYDTLRTNGLIVEAPIEVVSLPPAPPTVVPVVEIPATPVVPQVRPVDRDINRVERVNTPPSGLTRDLSSNIGSPNTRPTMTIRDIEKMPSEEYKRRLLSDKGFAKIVDDLYAKK